MFMGPFPIDILGHKWNITRNLIAMRESFVTTIRIFIELLLTKTIKDSKYIHNSQQQTKFQQYKSIFIHICDLVQLAEQITKRDM